MKSIEVLDKLRELGCDIKSEKTLQRWVKAELIPMPERKGAGRGKGKIADYPEDTVAEGYAYWLLAHEFGEFSQEYVSQLRKELKNNENHAMALFYLSIKLLALHGYTEAAKNISLDLELELKKTTNLNEEIAIVYCCPYNNKFVNDDLVRKLISFMGGCPSAAKYISCNNECMERVKDIKEVAYLRLIKKELVVYCRVENTETWEERIFNLLDDN